jgi:hypothetical protein
MPKSHPPYPPEYRRQIVELVRAGRTPGELGREFECSAQAIRNWVRQADLLFEVVTRRYLHCPIALTTSKPFAEWTEVFSSAGCVVTLVDRLIHRSELIALDVESYRLKEARASAPSAHRPRYRPSGRDRGTAS